MHIAGFRNPRICFSILEITVYNTVIAYKIKKKINIGTVCKVEDFLETIGNKTISTENLTPKF